jgi:UDP-N-acetylglucosamine acyltransferase
MPLRKGAPRAKGEPPVTIHPTAIVHPSVELDRDVAIGAYAVVGPHVRVGRRTSIAAHAVVEGPTILGDDPSISSFCVIGGAPQDKRAGSDPGTLVIGARNVFREHVTVHRGTNRRATTIGDDNLLMVGSHVAHDVVIGSFVTLANGVLLAGHVTIGDHATFGGAAAVAQHVRIGESAFVAGGAMVERDVPPYVVAQGDRARVRALNKIGLRRRGVDEASIAALERALRIVLFGQGTRVDRLASLAGATDPYVVKLVAAWT